MMAGYKGHYQTRQKDCYYNERGFDPDPELSELFTRLWELDTNKCYPDQDFEINLQGFVKNPKELQQDRARHELFQWVNEEIFERPTYKTFRALLDNYTLECGEAEVVTWEEKKENRDFIDAIMETDVMKEAHNYLVEQGRAPAAVNDFKCKLYNLWFMLIRRTKGDRDFDSSSFEHVFVGEARDDEFIGLHNWIQFYLQEKAGNIDYFGHFRRETIKDDKFRRLIAVQFAFKEDKGKPICSCFLGTSPEFEIAVYSILFFTRPGVHDVQLEEYEVEVACKKLGPKHIGTAYISAARM